MALLDVNAAMCDYLVHNPFERIPTRCWQPVGWLTVSPQRSPARPGVKSGAAGSFAETQSQSGQSAVHREALSLFSVCVWLLRPFDKRWAVGQVEWRSSTDKSPGRLQISYVGWTYRIKQIWILCSSLLLKRGPIIVIFKYKNNYIHMYNFGLLLQMCSVEICHALTCRETILLWNETCSHDKYVFCLFIAFS